MLRYDDSEMAGHLELPLWFLQLPALDKLDIIGDWIGILTRYYDVFAEDWSGDLTDILNSIQRQKMH